MQKQPSICSNITNDKLSSASSMFDKMIIKKPNKIIRKGKELVSRSNNDYGLTNLVLD